MLFRTAVQNPATILDREMKVTGRYIDVTDRHGIAMLRLSDRKRANTSEHGGEEQRSCGTAVQHHAHRCREIRRQSPNNPDQTFQPTGGATKREQVPFDGLTIDPETHGVSGAAKAASFSRSGRSDSITERSTLA